MAHLEYIFNEKINLPILTEKNYVAAIKNIEGRFLAMKLLLFKSGL